LSGESAYGDISTVPGISITKVLKVLKSTKYLIKSKLSHYDRLEIDVCREKEGEIVASNRRFAVWGKRDIKTAEKLRRRIKRLGISYERIATDNRDSFLSMFVEDKHEEGKKHPVRIGGTPPYYRHINLIRFRNIFA
jgi:hypothetical protein